MLALLIGCDDGPGLSEARARIDDVLAIDAPGTTIVQVGTDDLDRLTVTYGDRVGGEGLAAWLAECEGAGRAFDAEVTLEPGGFPWEVDLEDGDGDGDDECVRARLTTFPFEEPTGRGERDLAHVRWRPGVAVAGRTLRHAGATGADRAGGTGVRPAPVPPYVLVGRDDGAIDWDTLELGGTTVRYRTRSALGGGKGWMTLLPDARAVLPPEDDGAVPLVDPGAWARALTCEAPRLALVRTSLVFAGQSLERVATQPETTCVEDRAHEVWGALLARTTAGRALRDADHALVVLDVPVGGW